MNLFSRHFRTVFPLLLLLSAVLVFVSCRQSSASNEQTIEPLASMVAYAEDTDKIDVLADALAMNDDSSPKPSKNFRKGHVTPTTLKDYFETTSYGFKVNLKTTTQIPTPTVYKGKLYFGGGFGSRTFHCIEATTGKHLWSIDLDDDGPSSAVIQDDIVVFNTESCTIFACNANTGEMIWSYWLGDPLMSMPTIAGGKVFTSYPAFGGDFDDIQQFDPNPSNNIINEKTEGEDTKKEAKKVETAPRLQPSHVLICIDLKSGNIDWQKWIDGDVMSAPVANGSELYVVTFPGTFYKFAQKDGKILAASAARATSAPIITASGVFMTKRTDKEEASAEEGIAFTTKNDIATIRVTHNKKADYLDAEVQEKSSLKSTSASQDAGNGFGGGAPASSGWQKAYDNVGQGNVSSLQAYQGSRILNFRGDNFSVRGDSLICVPEGGGKQKWSVRLKGDLREAGGFLGTPPLAVAGKIVIGTLKGDVLVTDAASGKEVFRFETGIQIRQQPVVSEGWIYVGTTEGKVLAINTHDISLDGWPVWGGDVAHSGIAAN